MTIFLETARLVVRPFSEADLPGFVAYRNDETVARLQGWNTPYTIEQARAFLAEVQRLAGEGAPDQWLQLAIEHKPDGLLLGDIAFKLSGDARQAEIGCTLARPSWAQGYAGEALRTLLGYLFGELKLHRLYANCDVENQAAARALEKAGFRREAHFVENLWFKGRWSSEYWYALLASEYRE